MCQGENRLIDFVGNGETKAEGNPLRLPSEREVLNKSEIECSALSLLA